MFEDKFQNLFIKFCKINKFEINNKQVKIINLLDKEGESLYLNNVQSNEPKQAQ